MNKLQGTLLLLAYLAVVYAVAALQIGTRRATKPGYLLADREVPEWKAAFSIAASWIWAPALFVAAQKAYQQGVVGLFWFTAPNVLCLIFFAPFADIIRKKVPSGYTLTDYMRQRYGSRVHNVYMFQSGGLLVCSIAVQLLAGSKIVAAYTGLPFFWVTVAQAAIALSYSVRWGLRASIITDYLKINIIFLIILALIPWAVARAGGPAVVAGGFGGLSGRHLSLFDENGRAVFMNFGLPVTIGLLSGPFADQAFWQRAFAVERDKTAGAFYKSAFIFVMVPLSMSILGFLAASLKFAPREAQFVNVEILAHLLPAWTGILFAFAILSGLISALDSHMTAISCLSGHDIAQRMGVDAEDAETVIRYARLGPVIITIASIAIANIPNMQILYLFLFYGTLRASTMIPTMLTLISDTPRGEPGVFWGVLLSVFIGLPVFAYGNFNDKVPFIIAGSLLSLMISGVLSAAWPCRAATPLQ